MKSLACRVGEWLPEGSVALARRLRASTLVGNLLSVGSATLLSRLIGLIVLGYPARVLGPEHFGMVGFGLSATAYASILLSPGLVTWGTRAVARDRARAGQVLVAVRVIQGALALVAYGGIAAYAFWFVPRPEERLVILFCGLALFNTALSVDWVFNGLERMKTPAAIGVLNSALYVGALLLLVRSAEDLFLYAALTPAVGLVSVALGYWRLLALVRPAWPGWAAAKRALVDSFPLGITVALVVILHYANNLLVKAYLGAATLGVFLAAFRLVELCSTLPGLVSAVFLPRLARVTTSNPVQARRQAEQFARVLILLGAFTAAVALVEAEAIVQFIYGVKYAGAAELVRVMSVAIFFNFAMFGYTNALIAYGKDRVMIGVVLVSTVVSVGGGFLLVPRLGALGGALVIAVIDLAGWLVSLPAYRRTVGSLHLKGWVCPLLAGVAAGLCSWALQWAGVPFLGRLPVIALTFAVVAASSVRALLK